MKSIGSSQLDVSSPTVGGKYPASFASCRSAAVSGASSRYGACHSASRSPSPRSVCSIAAGSGKRAASHTNVLTVASYGRSIHIADVARSSERIFAASSSTCAWSSFSSRQIHGPRAHSAGSSGCPVVA